MWRVPALETGVAMAAAVGRTVLWARLQWEAHLRPHPFPATRWGCGVLGMRRVGCGGEMCTLHLACAHAHLSAATLHAPMQHLDECMRMGTAPYTH